jgi:hypothetical protein
MVDPDALQSAMDSAVHTELKSYTVLRRDAATNEADNRVNLHEAEIQKLKVGDLEVRNLKLRVIPAGAFGSGRRLIRGILGRDVIAESLVFAVDRDRGVAYLATQGNLSPLPDSTAVKFRHFYRRQLAQVDVDGQTVQLHLDLGARTSMMWEHRIQKANLARREVRAVLLDEFATPREVTWGGIAKLTTVGGVSSEDLLFIPFGDKRVDDVDLQGALGQNFFSKFHVTMNWHKKRMWLRPRSADLLGTASERLARFGNIFSDCEHPACVRIDIVRDAPEPSAPPESAPETGPEPASASAPQSASVPRSESVPESGSESHSGSHSKSGSSTGPAREIRLVREGPLASVAYEVLLEAVDASGTPLGLPRLLINLPGGIPTISERAFAPQYTPAAAFRVLDISPFPRPCDASSTGKRCVWQLPSSPH